MIPFSFIGERIDVMIEVYFDGASKGNPGPSGAGIYIKKGSDQWRYSYPLGEYSNHEAEFIAFNKALQICLEHKFSVVSFRTDSKLVCDAVEKDFVKTEQFRPYLLQAQTYIKQFDLFFIKWISSKENKNADELARKAIHSITK